MRVKAPTLAVIMLMIASLACIDSGKPTPPENELETAVAATLTAKAVPESDGHTIPTKPNGGPPPPGQATTDTLPPPESPMASVPRIVYTDGGDVWMIEATNPPVQLTSSGDASTVMISSDGQKVAFIRHIGPDQQHEIRSANADGSGEAILMTPAQIDALYPLDPNFTHNAIASIDFVPGSHDLMFNTRAVPIGPGLAKYNDLVLLNTDSGALTTIFAPGDGGDFKLSPDGTKIALITPENISLADADGSNMLANVVNYTGVITYSEFQYYAQPVWTLGSDAIGIAIPSSDPLAPGVSGTIWRVPVATGVAVNVGAINGDFYFSQFSSTPVLSPNLQRVAFLRETGTPNIKDLYLANADGSGQTVYDTGNIQWHGWSLDSTHFVYSLGAPSDLQLGEVGGTSTPIGSCTNLRWRDTNSYLCLSGSLGAWTLMRGQIGGSLNAIVSPTGDFIAYDFNR